MDADAVLMGTDLFGEPVSRGPQPPLADKFLFPPFSVLNARDGEWQERKRQWVALGIKSELGRDSKVYAIGDKEQWNASIQPGQSRMPACDYKNGKRADENGEAGTSVFDPVLCEVAYRWWCPKNGQIVDPFAGGSVRGIVAAMLGLRYWGCDLREEQIAANVAQANAITPNAMPVWICGDSMERLAEAPEADFIFSCPPYGDLERYSDDPRDLSTMDYHAFLAAYKRIIFRAAQRLKDNRLACFVVGDFRDDKGFYRNFHGETINAFEECGLRLYNDAVLVTAVGSLPIRVSGQFEKSRKLGKTHQNVLVFAKGDPRKAFAK